MNLLGAALYDPGTAVNKVTSALLAMTALDTTNLRITFTIPASGIVRVRMASVLHGATTYPSVLLGVMNGVTVVGRVAPIQVLGNTAVATALVTIVADFIVTGLTPGSVSWDAAYGVETIVASTGLKYGGPNNTTANDAWGAFCFEVWNPQNDPTNFALLSVDASGRIDVAKVAGTAQTGRDLGASVLLSTGTGTGQLDFTSGVVKANATQLLGTAWVAPAVAGTPDINVKNINNVAAATPGAAGGVFIAGANAATSVTTALTANITGNVSGSVGSIATGGITDASFVAGTGQKVVRAGTAVAGGASTITLDASASAVDSFYVGTTVSITGGTGVGQTRTISGYVGATQVATVGRAWITNPDATSTFAILPVSVPKIDSSLQVTAASVQGNVTGSVASVTGAVASVTGAVGSVTAAVTVGTNNDKTGYALSATGSAALTESYAADNVAPTLNQILYEIKQFLTEKNVAGTTLTVKKLDGATTAATYTLDSSTAPTSITRAT